MVRILIPALLLLIPTSFVFGAGFAKQSIFLSRSSVTEGESVLIHAVVSNNDPATFKGKLELRDKDEPIGTVPVSLESGKAIAVSVSWEPTAGKRTVSADLIDQEGTVLETMSESFTIEAKPKPKATTTAQTAATIESSEDIQNRIGGFSPQVQQATAPVFSTLDGVRNTIANTLDGQLKTANAKLGKIAGAEDENEGELPDTVGGFWLALWTVYFYILTVLRFLIGNAGIFYPAFALLFLYFLYKTFRRFRR